MKRQSLYNGPCFELYFVEQICISTLLVSIQCLRTRFKHQHRRHLVSKTRLAQAFHRASNTMTNPSKPLTCLTRISLTPALVPRHRTTNGHPLLEKYHFPQSRTSWSICANAYSGIVSSDELLQKPFQHCRGHRSKNWSPVDDVITMHW